MKWFAYCGLVFFTVAFAILLAFASGARAWDNGVALTPPMGWNSSEQVCLQCKRYSNGVERSAPVSMTWFVARFAERTYSNSRLWRNKFRVPFICSGPGASANFPPWHLDRLGGSSLAAGHLRCLFSDLPRVNDEFERVCILIFFHQLEVDEPFGVSHGSAVLEPASGRFKQRGG